MSLPFGNQKKNINKKKKKATDFNIRGGFDLEIKIKKMRVVNYILS